MEITPIKTRVLKPPQDNLLEAIKEASITWQDNDVIVISSKVVAISEGRCVKLDQANKEDLIKAEADVFFEPADSRWVICLKHGAFLSGAGVDESNANNHFILLPQEPQKSAKKLYHFFKQEYGLNNLAVIIADSHSMPMRYGTLGVALGWWGIEPIKYFTGQPDLFNRPAKFTRINVVDSLASAGVFAMGELSEQTPLCLIRQAPHLNFTDRDTSADLLVPPREDIYWSLIKPLYENNINK